MFTKHTKKKCNPCDASAAVRASAYGKSLVSRFQKGVEVCGGVGLGCLRFRPLLGQRANVRHGLLRRLGLLGRQCGQHPETQPGQAARESSGSAGLCGQGQALRVLRSFDRARATAGWWLRAGWQNGLGQRAQRAPVALPVVAMACCFLPSRSL